MLVTDLTHWKNHQHNEKSRQHNNHVTKILNRSLSFSQQHNDVTNITVTKWHEQKLRKSNMHRLNDGHDDIWLEFKEGQFNENTLY